MKIITDIPITTPRLCIRNATPDDFSALKSLCALWRDKEKLEGHGFDGDYIERTYEHKDLPPIDNATPDAHRLKVVSLKDRSEAVGFFEIYHGYAHEKMLWIGMFLMNPSCQEQGYGSEVLHALEVEALKEGYTHMGLGVYLKNWRGLRFWKSNGFNTIRGIYGDKEYSEHTFALMGLEKIL